jgi:hypothetical protein
MKPLPKTSIHLLIRAKVPMSEDGWKRWGKRQRLYISRHRQVFKNIIATKWEHPNGVPVNNLVTDERMAEWIMDNYNLMEGIEYNIQGWTKKKTKTGVGFTSTLARIRITNTEERKYEVWDSSRFRHYWFRRPMKGGNK